MDWCLPPYVPLDAMSDRIGERSAGGCGAQVDRSTMTSTRWVAEAIVTAWFTLGSFYHKINLSMTTRVHTHSSEVGGCR